MTVQRVTSTTGSGPTVFGNISDTIAAIWDGTVVKLTGTTESSGTYTCTWPNAAIPTSYADGMPIVITWDATNDGAAQLAITSGPGTKAIVNAAGDALTGGELVAGTSSLLVFHGDSDDHWRVMSSGSGNGGGSDYPLVNFAYFATPGADTWTPPYTCNALVIAVGGGGAGGRHAGASFSARATGGGAGGLVKKMVYEALVSTPFTINVGAGGAATTSNGGGLSGGTTTVVNVALGLAVSAGGGGGGGAGTGGTILGGAGGIGTGGEAFVGGAGGSASGSLTASGGGAVGVSGTGVSAANTSGNNDATAGAHAITAPIVPVGMAITFNGGGAFNDGTSTAAGNGEAYSGGGGSWTSTGLPDAGSGGIGAGGGGAASNNQGIDGGAGGDGIVLIVYSQEITS